LAYAAAHEVHEITSAILILACNIKKKAFVLFNFGAE
jgi:hypothetical protein